MQQIQAEYNSLHQKATLQERLRNEMQNDLMLEIKHLKAANHSLIGEICFLPAEGGHRGLVLEVAATEA